MWPSTERSIQRQQGKEPGTEDECISNEGSDGTPSPSNLSPSSSFRSSRGSAFTLWQDIPDVRTSGQLDNFSNEERKLQEVTAQTLNVAKQFNGQGKVINKVFLKNHLNLICVCLLVLTYCCMFTQAKFELVTSEASYIRSLTIAVDHFMLSQELAECLGAQDKQWLFSKLPEVKDVSER